MALTPEHRAFLNHQAITDGVLEAMHVSSVAGPQDVHLPEPLRWAAARSAGILFWWNIASDGRAAPQFRPDVPWSDAKTGKPVKYVFPSDTGSFTALLREPSSEDAPILVPEGTKQGLAALSWAPPEWGIHGVPGCQNWKGTDLSWAQGRKVMLLFDKDVTENRDVYDAATLFSEALMVDGEADRVVYAKLVNARSKDGLDDVLGARAPEKRTGYLERICADRAALSKLGRAPSRTKTNPYFGKDGGLLTRTAVEAVLDGQPAAVAKGGMVALYRDGAYRIDMGSEPLITAVTKLLGEEYRITWRSTVEEALVGVLGEQGVRLPETAGSPVLNCANGMLDLRTGELSAHSPAALSSVQIPVPWDPEAKAPRYEEWMAQYAPGQVDDLEESLSVMLDPSRIPSKAVFLYGPSKSGKSTLVRIAQEIAGRDNTSGVSLHQLEDDQFAAANLYGRMLNCSADLSAAHLGDTSLFKRLTGGDVVLANRKYGQQFSFTNQALFVFSANKIPTVSESSNAFINRIKPFLFPNSYEGHEDPRVEERLMEELPGILVRWVHAWQRLEGRGGYQETNDLVLNRFVSQSDRVRLWVAQAAQVHPDVVGTVVGADKSTGRAELYLSFKQWLEREGGAGAMRRSDFLARLGSLPGVGEVRMSHRNKNVGLSVSVLPEDEWGSEESYSDISDMLAKSMDKSPTSGQPECEESARCDFPPVRPMARSVGHDHLLNSPGHRSNGETLTPLTPLTPPDFVTESDQSRYGSNPFLKGE